MVDDDTRKKLLTRLSRVEGQLGAVRRMVQEDAHCSEALVQIAAVRGALSKVGQILIAAHIEQCVSQALESGDAEARKATLDELMEIFNRFGGQG